MATTDKYDRQLRLWGANGQRALGETTVVLFRATASGTETLKNLVLPGIGRILVVDDHDAGSDYASNFFVTQSSTGSRAQIALDLLQELNPDVQGKWKHVESLKTVNLEELLLSAAPDVKTLLVIGADLEPPLLKILSSVCSDHAIPLICVHAYGLIGSVRLQTPPLPLMQPKPSAEQPDLRLMTSFSQFTAFADSIHLSDLDNADHGHVPYPILLYKLAQDWKCSHDGTLPVSIADKQAFRKFVQDAARKPDMQLNFMEARDNAYLAYTQKSICEQHLQTLIQRSKDACPKFHAMLTGLWRFIKEVDPQGPLHGTIPDMTSSTTMYIQLQQMYHAKAMADLETLRLLVPPGVDVDDEELEVFCKNAHQLDLLQTQTIANEYNDSSVFYSDDILESLDDPYENLEHTPLLWYLGLRACHLFFEQHGRYPSEETDVVVLQGCIQHVVVEINHNVVTSTLLSPECKYAKELTRYANAEIHTIASVIGGVASQEAVKIITGQYVPFNNTYIYNGIVSTGGVYKL